MRYVPVIENESRRWNFRSPIEEINLSMTGTAAKKPYFTTVEILFLASMIGLDFAYGMVVGPILSATGVLEIIRVDMVIPVILMLVTRLLVDKFGTLVIYELVWGILAMLARPGTFGGMPAIVKLVPAVTYGLILDSCMEMFKDRLYFRLLIAGVVGGIVNQFAFMGIRVLFGLPWSTAVQVFLGINIVTNVIVNIIAVQLTSLVWKGVERSGWSHRLHAWRTS